MDLDQESRTRKDANNKSAEAKISKQNKLQLSVYLSGGAAKIAIVSSSCTTGDQFGTGFWSN
jgi:hypothetical protein